MRTTLFAFSLALAGLACEKAGQVSIDDGCSTDLDCPTPQICVAGTCESPPGGTGTSGTVSTSGTTTGTGGRGTTAAGGTTGAAGSSTGGTTGVPFSSCPGQACQSICEPSPFPTYLVGDGITGIGAGDFNGDGITDLAFSDGTSVTDIAFLWGNGDGTFGDGGATVAIPDAGTSGPGPLVVADFDGDGQPDVAACASETYVVVLLSRGAGTFAPPGIYAAPCYRVAAVDLGKNGRQDIAVVSGGATTQPDSGYLSTLTVLLNDGGGGFPTVLNQDGHTLQTGIASGDLNGDGWPDLVASGNNNDGTGLIEVYFGDGSGGLNPAVDVPAPTSLFSDVVGDFNGDGRPDVAGIYQVAGPGNLLVFLNVDGGQLGAPQILTSAASPIDLTAADFNGDGALDLAVAGYDGLEIWLQQDGGLVPPSKVYPALSGFCVIAADLNGDGRPDVATSNYSAQDAVVVLNLCQ